MATMGDERVVEEELSTSASVAIDTPIHKVWAALTTPDTIERWFFGVQTETDWREGSPIVHRGEYRGQPYEDKGEIVRIDPPYTLVHTHWSPTSGLPDEPESYQTVTWSLDERDDGLTELTVAEDNLPSEQALRVSEDAWASALDALKVLLEK
jgi:uncharacterized protein YndB with AHSA1/START domain